MTYPGEVDVEAPVEDAAEQARAAFPGAFDDEPYEETSQDPEAPEWDAREQHRIVELDDEYR